MKWVRKSLLRNEYKNVFYENDNGDLREKEMIQRLKSLICESRDNTHLKIVLLASGGHFVGCVFDANIVIAHKTSYRLGYFFFE